MSDAPEQPLRRLPRFKPRSGLEVMYASIRALFLRELQTRFGHYRLGYVWVLLEPTLNIIFILILFSAIMERTLPGIDYAVFLVNGVLPFFLFMRSASKSLSAIESNRGLLSYKSVKTLDTVIARTTLEALLYFGCYIFISTALLWIGFYISFSNIPELLMYWGALYLFSIGFACVMMVIGELNKEVGKFISSVFLVLYFMSGVLFPLHIVPEQYLGYFLWNPMAHILELMRHSISEGYAVTKGVTFSYFMMCTISILFLGLLLNQSLQKRLLKSK